MNKIILIGNYPLDKQESMLRFASMLMHGFEKKDIDVVCWKPVVVFGFLFKQTNQGLGKWMGYLDKWLLFPLILRIRVLLINKEKHTVRFHICDHSNAPYAASLPQELTSITCHDVLAIQGALGYPNTYCEASAMGKKLQKWILKHLQQVNKMVAVSHYTLSQLTEISTDTISANRNWRVIHNAFNERFYPIEIKTADEQLISLNEALKHPYLLHVGSDLPRKNRKLLVDMIAILRDRWNGNICFAGQAIDKGLQEYIKEKGVEDRVISLVNPDHQALLALYSRSEAFVFPSFSEGFGWPIIEAQACRTPVLVSNIAPMPEVSGGVALYADPHNSQSFVEALTKLWDSNQREWYVQQGEKNVQQYHIDIMIEKYLDLLDLKSKL